MLIKEISQLTDGLTGADIEAIIQIFANEYVIFSSKDKKTVFHADTVIRKIIAEYRIKIAVFGK